MKIVLYVNSFLPSIGGREVVVHYLAREYKRMGHDVRVFGPSGWITHRRLRFEYPVHRWPTLRGLFVEKVVNAQLRLDIGIWGCDIIHAHNTFPNGYAAAQLKQKSRIPLIITPHGHDIHMIPEIGFGLRLDACKRRRIETAIRRADILTAISDSIEASLMDAGCPPEKIRKIRNGIDIERFQQKNLPDIRRWLGIAEQSPIILSVGNHHPRKGYEVLLRSMPHILSQVDNATLVIVGGRQDSLRPLIDTLAISDHVRLAGRIGLPAHFMNHSAAAPKNKDDRLAALYRESNVYVSAGISEGAEGLSLAVLDAMAARLPVVATRISGNKDIVKDTKSGFLVPPSDPERLADAVVNILKHPRLKASMGAEGHTIVKPFGWKEIALTYLDAYNEAIETCRHV
jgi:glycosyltransferase involved in cell wall biosynthesis